MTRPNRVIFFLLCLCQLLLFYPDGQANLYMVRLPGIAAVYIVDITEAQVVAAIQRNASKIKLCTCIGAELRFGDADGNRNARKTAGGNEFEISHGDGTRGRVLQR